MFISSLNATVLRPVRGDYVLRALPSWMDWYGYCRSGFILETGFVMKVCSALSWFLSLVWALCYDLWCSKEGLTRCGSSMGFSASTIISHKISAHCKLPVHGILLEQKKQTKTHTPLLDFLSHCIVIIFIHCLSKTYPSNHPSIHPPFSINPSASSHMRALLKVGTTTIPDYIRSLCMPLIQWLGPGISTAALGTH
jgi:hypothetical protein